MSFILDALRKAERERSLGKPPDLNAMTQPAMPLPAHASNRYRALRLAILSGLIIACVATLAVLRHHQTVARTTLLAAAPARTDTTATIAAPAPDDGFARADNPLTADDTDTDNPSVNTLDDLASNSAANDDEEPNSSAPLPAQAEDSAPPKTAMAPTRSEPAPAPTESAPAENETAPGAATPAATPRSEADTPPATVEQLTLAPAPAPAVPLLKDMPADYRSAFPTLTVDVHSYDPQPKKRFVMVNGHNYREGDTLAEGPRIVSIVNNGIVFDYRGQQVLFTIGGH